MFLAKPYGDPPIILKEHLDRVAGEGGALVDAYPYCQSKYKKYVKKSLRDQVCRAGQYHDWGKAHPKWQKPCKADRDYHLKTGKYGNNLRNAGFRHEFDSLRQTNKNGLKLSEGEKAAIAAHHGKLSYAPKNKKRWLKDNRGVYKKEWEYFNGLVHGKYSKYSIKELLIKRYEIAGVRSFLRFADSRVSARESGTCIPPINHEFEINENQYPELRPVQEAALEHAEKQEIILRAPTGSGKTWAALLWANQQINMLNNADRLIIAMPTRFTSNSLSMDVSKNIGETGLYHSSAWFKYDELKKGKDQKKKDALDEELRMARYLMMPANITTIDHLLMCLTGTREDHHHIFFSLMHACVVIDEADFYDPFVQANIVKLLEVLRIFDIRIMIMSATVPASAQEQYSINALIDPYNKDNPINTEAKKEALRTRCNVVRHGKCTPEKLLNQLLIDAELQPTIIFANTVQRALQYYDWFKDKAISPDIYHSRFTEPDKKRLEEKIIKKLGKKAWEDRSAHGVVILTQIGEMSLNISAPFMISDVCPFDRLAQRAGRLSRFEGMEAGRLHTVIPIKNEAIYPAPYGEYNRKNKEWIPYAAFTETLVKLKNGPYSAADFTKEVNSLYPKSERFEGQAEHNQEKLEEHLKNDWLILPAAKTGEKDFETDEWRSRNIPQQQTVLTQMPDSYISYREYHKFELEYGISCPMYQIGKGKSLNRVEDATVFVGNEEKEQPIIVSNIYSRTIGLILDEDRERPTEDQFV